MLELSQTNILFFILQTIGTLSKLVLTNSHAVIHDVTFTHPPNGLPCNFPNPNNFVPLNPIFIHIVNGICKRNLFL